MSNPKTSTRSSFRTLRSGRKFIDQFILSTAIVIVLVSFLFMISGCSYYKISTRFNPQSDTFFKDLLNEVYPVKKYPREFYIEDNLVKMFFQQSDIYILDSNGRWHLINPELSGDTIIGKAQSSPIPAGKKNEMPETRKSGRYSASKESDIIKRINLYVDNVNFNDSGTIYIPVSSINKCEIYKKDKGKTSGIVIGTVIISAGAVFGFLYLMTYLVVGDIISGW